MVQEILKNIEQKVKEQLLKIKEDKNRQLLALEEKYRKLQGDQKQRSLARFKQKIESEIQEFSQKRNLELEFAVLRKKNEIVQKLYKEAEKRIDIDKLVVSLFPKDIDGKIRAGKRTAEILKQVTDKEITDDLEEEGFLIIGENVDLDFRVSEILKQKEQEQKPELAKLIFN